MLNNATTSRRNDRGGCVGYCDIRSLHKAFETTFPRLSLLPIPQRASRIEMLVPAHLQKRKRNCAKYRHLHQAIDLPVPEQIACSWCFWQEPAGTWKHAHITRSTRDAPAVASPGIQALLEIQVQGSFCQTKGSRRDRSVDSGMAVQIGVFGAERIHGELLKLGLRVSLPHDPEVHETSAHCKAARAELEDFLTHAC